MAPETINLTESLGYKYDNLYFIDLDLWYYSLVDRSEYPLPAVGGLKFGTSYTMLSKHEHIFGGSLFGGSAKAPY